MSPRQFADLAVAVARHAEELSFGDGPDAAALHRVWKRAGRCFRIWREELVTSATPRLYAELFAVELPLRVWCTAVVPSRRSRSAGASIAGRVFSDMLELRCMVLQALAADYGLTAVEAATLDRFRRRCERWTDVLIGPLAARTGVSDFAVRPDRAGEFAGEIESDPFGDATWPLIAAGLRLTFAAADEFRGPAAERQTAPAAELSSAILASFPPAAFGGDGCLRSPAAGRVGRIVNETAPTRRHQIHRPSAPVVTPPPPVEAPRPPHGISFVSLRKRRPTE